MLVTRFERSVEVQGYSNALKFSIVSLDLHRGKEITPRDIMKSEKGNKKTMNRKIKQLNNKRTKQKRRLTGKI